MARQPLRRSARAARGGASPAPACTIKLATNLVNWAVVASAQSQATGLVRKRAGRPRSRHSHEMVMYCLRDETFLLALVEGHEKWGAKGERWRGCAAALGQPDDTAFRLRFHRAGAQLGSATRRSALACHPCAPARGFNDDAP